MVKRKKMKIGEALTRIENMVCSSVGGLDGLRDVFEKSQEYTYADMINAHARNLERIITDLELFYRPELGLDIDGKPIKKKK